MMEGQRWILLCPDQSVASDFMTPQFHTIKDESGVIGKGVAYASQRMSGIIYLVGRSKLRILISLSTTWIHTDT